MDADEDAQIRSVIARAFHQYRQYHETVALDELDRVERLGRIGRAAADELGGTLSTAAVPQRDGMVRICLWFTAEAPMPEPA